MITLVNASPKRQLLKRSQIEKLVAQKLFEDYYITDRDYDSTLIKSIMFNEPCHIVALYKEFLLMDDTSEFLKRFYSKGEISSRLPKLTIYFDTYSKIYPNYNSIKEGKYFYRNIKRKQKMIDLHEKLLRQEKRRKKRENNEKNGSEEEDESPNDESDKDNDDSDKENSDNDDKEKNKGGEEKYNKERVFDTKVYETILNDKQDLEILFGLLEDSNTSENIFMKHTDKIISIIDQCEQYRSISIEEDPIQSIIPSMQIKKLPVKLSNFKHQICVSPEQVNHNTNNSLAQKITYSLLSQNSKTKTEKTHNDKSDYNLIIPIKKQPLRNENNKSIGNGNANANGNKNQILPSRIDYRMGNGIKDLSAFKFHHSNLTSRATSNQHTAYVSPTTLHQLHVQVQVQPETTRLHHVKYPFEQISGRNVHRKNIDMNIQNKIQRSRLTMNGSSQINYSIINEAKSHTKQKDFLNQRNKQTIFDSSKDLLLKHHFLYNNNSNNSNNNSNSNSNINSKSNNPHNPPREANGKRFSNHIYGKINIMTSREKALLSLGKILRQPMKMSNNPTRRNSMSKERTKTKVSEDKDKAKQTYSDDDKLSNSLAKVAVMKNNSRMGSNSVVKGIHINHFSKIHDVHTKAMIAAYSERNIIKKRNNNFDCFNRKKR